METQKNNTNYDQICKQIVDNKVFPYLFDSNGYDLIENKTKISETDYLTSLLILKFDDDIGQIAEQIWPPNSLDKNTIKQISALGFPETNSFKKEGEIEYVFKVRQNNHIPLKCTSITDQKFFYCYTLFVQLKRNNYKRGYLQKSFVIVSRFYCKKLFCYLLSEFKSILYKIGRRSMINNENNNSEIEFDLNISLDQLEKIFNIFSKGIDKNLNLDSKNVEQTEISDLKLAYDIESVQTGAKENPEDFQNFYKSETFFEKHNNPSELDRKYIVDIKIKDKNYISNQFEQQDLEIKKSISTSDTNLDESHIENDHNFSKYLKLSMEISVFPQNNNFVEYLSFYYLCKIWNLWELVITETPLIIQTDTPNICQEVVFLLSSLIFPLEYVGDIRPYFTIYDTDFKDYRDDSRLKFGNSALIGVINPICTRMLKGWTIIHFDDLYFQQLKIENPTKLVKRDYIDEDGIITGIENCKRKFILSPNKILLKTVYELLQNLDEKSFDKINIYLRMFMIELNNDFMRTFEEYFFSFQYTKIKRLPLIKNNFSIFEIFEENNFLKYLNTSEIYFNTKYVKDKKKSIELYTHFIQTKSFKNYLKNLM